MTAIPADSKPSADSAETAGAGGPAGPSGPVLHGAVIDWFDGHARDLPWRRPDAGPWAVMVSEFMLQQTPVNRVLPVYEQWLARWPSPADLAAGGPPPGGAPRGGGGRTPPRAAAPPPPARPRAPP
ncbi:hypothetical protein ACFV1F_44160, partial [Streptomyces sp. NPDC059590]